MLRLFTGTLVALAVLAGTVFAADKSERENTGRQVTGLIKKVHPTGKETILAVKQKDRSEMEQRVMIGPDSKLILSGKDKKPLKGEQIFRCPDLKEDARATVVFDAANQAAE